MITLKKIQKIPKNVVKLDQIDKNELLDKYGCEKGHLHFFINDTDVYAWLITECYFVINEKAEVIQAGKYLLA